MAQKDPAGQTLAGSRSLICDETTLRMSIERGISIADCYYATWFVDDAAPSAGWPRTRPFSDRSSAGRVIVGTVKRQQQHTLARFSAQLRKLRIIVGDDLSAKNFAVCCIEDREVRS
jgi:hypothetical protein